MGSSSSSTSTSLTNDETKPVSGDGTKSVGPAHVVAMPTEHGLVWPPQAYNTTIDWEMWEDSLEIYFLGKNVETEIGKRILLLNTLGVDTLSSLIKWCHPKKPRELTQGAIAKLREKFSWKKYKSDNKLDTIKHLQDLVQQFILHEQATEALINEGKPKHEAVGEKFLGILVRLFSQLESAWLKPKLPENQRKFGSRSTKMVVGRLWIQEFKVECDKFLHKTCNQIQDCDEIKRVLEEYQEVFSDEFGKYNLKIRLELKEGANPKFVKTRNLSYALVIRLEHSLMLWSQVGFLKR